MHPELVLIACTILAVFLIPSLITVRTGQIAAAGADPDQIAPVAVLVVAPAVIEIPV